MLPNKNICVCINVFTFKIYTRIWIPDYIVFNTNDTISVITNILNKCIHIQIIWIKNHVIKQQYQRSSLIAPMIKIHSLNKVKSIEFSVCVHKHVYASLSKHEGIYSFLKYSLFFTVMKRKCFSKVKETFVPWHLPLCLINHYIVVNKNNPWHMMKHGVCPN